MSARRLSLVAALLVLPTLVTAQRTRSSAGGHISDRGKMDLDTAGARKSGILATKDLQKENMIAFVLDKKKDLKLGDDEVKALKTIQDHLKDTVSAPMNSLDSITNQMRRTGDLAPSESDRNLARLIGAQRVSEVRSQYEAALKDALTKLTEEHQKAASDLIDARRKELTPDKPRL